MKINLRLKLSLFFASQLLFISVVLTVFIMITMASNELSTREQFIRTITEISSAGFGQALQAEDRGELLAQLKGLTLSFSTQTAEGERKSDAAFVVAFKNGVLFEGINKDALDGVKDLYFPQTRTMESRSTRDFIIVSNPVYERGKLIGALVFGYSLDSYQGMITGNVGLVTVILLVFIGITMVATLVFINRIVLTVNVLKEHARKISEGDLGLEAVKIKSKDEIAALAGSFDVMTHSLKTLIGKVRDITVSLNSASKEIEAAAQEQTTASNEHASGITEVSATLEELSITARQITSNAGELVVASEEAIKLLKKGEGELSKTVQLLAEVGQISGNNTASIGLLGKKSEVITEMVEIIKDVSNKTNMLSINASIEASRAGEAGKGFSVVAAEIRELSKETISSAKKVGEAGREIQNLLDTIIVSSESESRKVIDCGATVKDISKDLETIVTAISDNYNFTQKIDVSIKQQEIGSGQAAETMKQMAEIAQQSAETARQTLVAVKNIVGYSMELGTAVETFKL